MSSGRLLVAMIALPALAGAQRGGAAPATGSGIAIMGDPHVRTALQRAIGLAAIRPGGNVALPDSSYRASPEVTARVKRQFIAVSQRQFGPKVGGQMTKAITNLDFVGLWSKTVAGDGMKPGSVADALAEYWTINWMVVNGVTASTRAQNEAVRRQIGAVVLGSAGFRRLSNAGRQELAETLMLSVLLQQAAFGAALRKGDKATLATLSGRAVRLFQGESAVDLRGLKLTDGGFVRKAG